MSGEEELIRWLRSGGLARREGVVELGVGDDMAMLRLPGGSMLVSTDMLLDGVHFDRTEHDLESIGRKALACGLSDCAAMAVEPVGATVSLALPQDWTFADTVDLYRGIKAMADRFNCVIVGGDTTSWSGRLAIDVAVVARPFAESKPICRSTARVGDLLYVTGKLGGSRLGRHMTFTPRVHESRELARALGADLHALMDISDGLALDLHRMCEASHVGARLAGADLKQLIHDDAKLAAQQDDLSALEHALYDGEDFELLVAVDVGRENYSDWPTEMFRIGTAESGVEVVVSSEGGTMALPRRGYEHLS